MCGLAHLDPGMPLSGVSVSLTDDKFPEAKGLWTLVTYDTQGPAGAKRIL